MKLIDEPLLDHFRRQIRCEFCGRRCPNGCDPAHVYSRGAGRVDIPENLAALCRACHTKSHDGNRPNVADLELVVALRMGIMPEDIKPAVDRIRNVDPKTGKPRREMP